MRALVMDGFGPPSNASVDEVPMPACRACDVLIAVRAAGINPVDWKECEGRLEQFYGKYEARWVPGYDVAGIVHAVGANVRAFKPGDRVVAFSDRRENGHNGTFAEYVRVLDHAVALVPDAVELADAAAIPTAALTGYQALHRTSKADLGPGDTVLIHGASGGVGSYTVQFAKAAGLRVVATCSGPNISYVASLGADLVIDYSQGQIIADVREWEQKGVDAVIDCVSGGTLPPPEEILRPGGKLISIATLTQDGDISGDMEKAAERGYSKVFSIMEFDRIGYELADVLALMATGKVKPPPLTIYPLEAGREALQAMKDGGVRGKIVLEMGLFGRPLVPGPDL
jgi:NADPH2:quinone reductase